MLLMLLISEDLSHDTIVIPNIIDFFFISIPFFRMFKFDQKLLHAYWNKNTSKNPAYHGRFENILAEFSMRDSLKMKPYHMYRGISRFLSLFTFWPPGPIPEIRLNQKWEGKENVTTPRGHIFSIILNL